MKELEVFLKENFHHWSSDEDCKAEIDVLGLQKYIMFSWWLHAFVPPAPKIELLPEQSNALTMET